MSVAVYNISRILSGNDSRPQEGQGMLRFLSQHLAAGPTGTSESGARKTNKTRCA